MRTHKVNPFSSVLLAFAQVACSALHDVPSAV